MKNCLTILFLLISLSLFSQKTKEVIIFKFDEVKDTIKYNKNTEIYLLDKQHSFKYDAGKHKKEEVSFNSVKGKMIRYDEFIHKTKGKKYPEYFNNYSFYIFLKEKGSLGCLIEVEKIWLVEDKIIN